MKSLLCPQSSPTASSDEKTTSHGTAERGETLVRCIPQSPVCKFIYHCRIASLLYSDGVVINSQAFTILMYGPRATPNVPVRLQGNILQRCSAREHGGGLRVMPAPHRDHA